LQGLIELDTKKRELISGKGPFRGQAEGELWSRKGGGWHIWHGCE
jgi:hypothetical protein